jgi:hypothetical protein
MGLLLAGSAVSKRPHLCCTGCGIPLSDGYVLGCNICSGRRSLRLKRGERFTATGFPCELIDNSDKRGRLIIGEAA